MKTAMIIVALLGFSSVVAAQDGSATTKQVEQYRYGTHLDVAKVLSSTDISQQCGVIPAQLNYLDSQGREHVLDYQVNGSGCTNDH